MISINTDYNEIQLDDSLIEDLIDLYDIDPALKSDFREQLLAKINQFSLDYANSNPESDEVDDINFDLSNTYSSSLLEEIADRFDKNGKVHIVNGSQDLLTIESDNDKVTYTLGNDVDLSKLSSDNLVRAYDSDDFDDIKPLILETIESVKKGELA